MSDFFTGASTAVRDSTFLDNGTLFISEAYRRSPEMLSFLSLARKRGVVLWEFLDSKEFQKRKAVANKGQSEFQGSELQAMAIKLFETAYTENASDIHITDYGTYGIIQFRCLGLLRSYSQLPGKLTAQLISVIYGTMGVRGSTTAHTPTVRQDARIVNREYLPEQVHSIRVHTEPIESVEAGGGVGCFMALRLLYDRTEATGDLSSRLTVLGYAKPDIEQVESLTERSGMNLISGPTGHGKSTLLKHSMEAQAEKRPEKGYFSIEDPPEYPLANVKQIMVSTGDTADPESRGRNYIDAIAGAMRSDPDVIMIGEIRFPEAAVAAIDAALTGHGVWATIHANDALGIIMRMRSLLNSANYAEPLEYLCDPNVTAGLIYQRLVPVLCESCKVRLGDATNDYKAEVLPKQVLERLAKVVRNSEQVHIRGRGCEHCRSMGFVSQTVAAEVIIPDQELLSLVRNGDMKGARKYWVEVMKGETFVRNAINKIEAGLLDPYMTEVRLGAPLTFASSGEGAYI